MLFVKNSSFKHYIIIILIFLIVSLGLKEVYLQNNMEHFQFVVPIYNNKGLETVTCELKNYIRPNDIFLLVSGNFSPINISWVNQSAAILKTVFPDSIIMVGTNGLANVELLAQNIRNSPIESIVYIYEPNSLYGTEFTWDFHQTIINFNKASQIAHSHNKHIMAKPTGRPILKSGLQKYNWDYSVLGNSVEHMFIQTQTYCKDGTGTFKRALNKLLTQYRTSGLSLNWFPEVSIDPDAPNGVSVEMAVQCTQIVKHKGFSGILVWWSPAHKDRAVKYFQSLRKY